MSALEHAVRRLLAERDRDAGSVGYRLDLWNDLSWAYEAARSDAPPTLSPTAIAARAANLVRPAELEVRP